MKTILLAMATLALAGCVAQVHDFPAETHYPASREEVWDAVAAYFAETETPVTLNKGSWFAAVPRLHYPVDEFETMADCGSMVTIEEKVRGEGKADVFVRSLGDNVTSVAMNTEYRLLLRYKPLLTGVQEWYLFCNSRGLWEQRVYDAVSARLAGASD